MESLRIKKEKKQCQWKDFYEPVRIENTLSNNYIEYKSEVDKNKMLLTEEHLNKIRHYLSNMINDLKTQGE